MIKTAIIGVGNMGSKYAKLLQDDSINGMELVAMTRVGEAYKELLKPSLEKDIPIFQSSDDLFDAIESKSIEVDAVIIATPHYAHQEQAVSAFKNNLHVLSDKPAGVYTRQAREMEEAAIASGKEYGMVFNQRTNPLYQQIRQIIKSGQYGKLKRVNWVVTNWYRPDKYFSSSPWRATWAKDGGGVLLNQCPHNLDLLTWMCGMPDEIQGFCSEGHFHPIEVEDDATIFMRWANGATGTFITSTGDAPGVNRLEISLDEAMLVCENDELKIGELKSELGCSESDYRKTSTDYFRKIKGNWKTLNFDNVTNAYQIVLQGFANKIMGTGEMVAEGTDGYLSLMISNAAYLSSWKNKMIKIPSRGSQDELDFEKEFEEELSKKCN